MAAAHTNLGLALEDTLDNRLDSDHLSEADMKILREIEGHFNAALA